MMNILERSIGWLRRHVTLFRVIAWLMIVVLFSFLLPAFSGVRGPRGITTVRAEISALESAIASFQKRFGIEPPSSIQLHATLEGWENDPTSRARIQQIWPEFDFAACGGMSHVPAEGIRLNGAECLVFFLGGVVDPTTGQAIGFSKNPARPFELGGGRDTSVYGFELSSTAHPTRPTSRFVDLDGDGFREYLDCLPGQTKPLLYISSHDGQGYDPADFDGAMQEVYRQGTEPDATPWKAKSFQIISPGADHEYGLGGVYNPASNELANNPLRKAEFDNYTNFAPDVLVVQPTLLNIDLVHLAMLVGMLLLAVLACWVIWLGIRPSPKRVFADMLSQEQK